MFTGIIEEIGTIKSFVRSSIGATIVISCKKVLENSQLGDSICVNGICQTIVKMDNSSFQADLSDETLSVTALGNLKIGDEVNLERALTLNTRLGGHVVSGHVDCVGQVLNIQKTDSFYNISFVVPNDMAKYIVYKGSITVNGVSLTVAKIEDNNFGVAIIPHTFENTIFKNLKVGDKVNIETDILAKYVEKMINTTQENNSKISYDFLAQNGFV